MTYGNAITVYRGDDRVFTLTFTNSSGVAIDISNYTIFFTVKSSFNDTDANAVISKTVTSHSDPTHGITTVTLAAADTDTKTPGAYIYDIQTKDGSGKIFTAQVGDFILESEVTRRIV